MTYVITAIRDNLATGRSGLASSPFTVSSLRPLSVTAGVYTDSKAVPLSAGDIPAALRRSMEAFAGGDRGTDMDERMPPLPTPPAA